MPRHIRRPRKLRLYNALKIGYLRNEAKQKNRLKRFGYRLDEDLTTRERTVAFNPVTRKVIFIDNGTQITSPKDLYTDVAGIGLGRLDKTPRYAENYDAYLKAKKKYDTQVVLVGHSLGGAEIAKMVAPEDRAITYNAANVYQKPKTNVYNYRTKGDLFSALANDTKTLQNPVSGLPRLNPIQPHNVSNIKSQPIFI